MLFFSEKLKRAINILYREPAYVTSQLKSLGLHQLTLKTSNFVGGRTFLLNTVFFILTFNCNLKCFMCGLWGEQGVCRGEDFKVKEEMELKDWQRVIAEVAAFKPGIILFGGEPLLYKEWYKIAAYAKQKKLRVHLPVNGTLVLNNLEKILKYVDNLDFSLDGLYEIHNEIRGRKNIFEEALQALEEIVKIKKQKKQVKPYININATVSEKNYFHLVEFVEFFENRGLPINLFNFQNVEFTDNETYLKNKKIVEKNFGVKSKFWKGCLTNQNNLNVEKLIQQINTLKEAKYENIKFIEFEPDFNEDQLRAYYNRPAGLKIKNKCMAPWFQCMVLPDGNVWICPDIIVGNVKKENILNIINSDKAKKFRKYLIKHKQIPICGNCYTVFDCG